MTSEFRKFSCCWNLNSDLYHKLKGPNRVRLNYPGFMVNKNSTQSVQINTNLLSSILIFPARASSTNDSKEANIPGRSPSTFSHLSVSFVVPTSAADVVDITSGNCLGASRCPKIVSSSYRMQAGRLSVEILEYSGTKDSTASFFFFSVSHLHPRRHWRCLHIQLDPYPFLRRRIRLNVIFEHAREFKHQYIVRKSEQSIVIVSRSLTINKPDIGSPFKSVIIKPAAGVCSVGLVYGDGDALRFSASPHTEQ